MRKCTFWKINIVILFFLFIIYLCLGCWAIFISKTHFMLVEIASIFPLLTFALFLIQLVFLVFRLMQNKTNKFAIIAITITFVTTVCQIAFLLKLLSIRWLICWEPAKLHNCSFNQFTRFLNLSLYFRLEILFQLEFSCPVFA